MEIVPDAHHAETPPNNNGDRFHDHLESSETLSGVESSTDSNHLDATFEDAMKTMEARQQTALPKNLQGGVLLDQTYATEPKDLNSLLHEPNSQFRTELAQHQGTTDYEESSWRWKPNDDPCFSRCVTYTKAATKLVKAVDVIEEQVYLLADGKNFAILNRVTTPDVPYGDCFQVLLLYKITPGPESSLGEKSSRLVVSWDINFHRNTVMKSVIEGTARQGFNESYESFSETLSQFIKPLSSSDQLLEPLQSSNQSDCKLFLNYFWNDYGLEEQGDGWQLTIALIEGCRLPSASPGYPDPYVVFTCNGRSRTSSVQLQTENPKWNEILEFSAMQEPPSVLDVKVFSFDSPFDQEIPVGHAEIKFLKQYSSAELADCWIPLEGKLARSSQSKLHLRIFVENTGGDEIIREYLQKMEKEVGKKMNPPSSHKNSTFQKVFGLPSEEFLIHEFSCCLKRKLPLQGKNFLSARIFGFYSNLFGYKTKFFFLWEDIECIQVVPPSLMAVGTSALLIILRNGRGLDARHGAKSIDDEGRLKFQFQSYKSFDRASRTIMALWRSKTCDEQQHKSENDQPDRFVYSDKSENDSFSNGDFGLSASNG
ncbi:hypothetical protein ZIOFF_004984 [Zingiber officinale]|uniref:C2 domain-containing protein n=1 Tax=Zingiber officinale TaxID=94328 RepID=A0A8J5LRD4_ZINOF|nr:hypothetical protein ZIOFF_004984 [Zingiber officinale]